MQTHALGLFNLMKGKSVDWILLDKLNFDTWGQLVVKSSIIYNLKLCYVIRLKVIVEDQMPENNIIRYQRIQGSTRNRFIG